MISQSRRSCKHFEIVQLCNNTAQLVFGFYNLKKKKGIV